MYRLAKIIIILYGMISGGLQTHAQNVTGTVSSATISSLSSTNSASNTIGQAHSAKPQEPLALYLDRNRERYKTAIQRAKTWVDNLEIDPMELRAHRVKGKKKLAECLDFYIRLWSIASPEEKTLLMTEMKKRAAITYEPRYHDMGIINNRQFKEDATSYLRVAFLMDRNGMDTTRYREEIKKILPRLNAHMVIRGTDQRMAFHLYYQHFGLAEPFSLKSAFKAGVIAARKKPADFQHKMDVYSLTHEIFVPYQFGNKLDARFFSNEDKTYLRHALDILTQHYIKLNNPDVVGELSSCLSYLQLTDLPVYRQALSYLLNRQQADGKWGNYESYRLFYGRYADQGFYLHTTLVVVNALTMAFQIINIDEQ